MAGKLEYVKLLISYGTRLNDRDSLGGTALTTAMYTRKPGIAAYLIDQGANFNTYNVNDFSASWVLNRMIKNTILGNPIHKKFKTLRDLMVDEGMQWSPLSPEEVRVQGESIGLPNTSSEPRLTQ